MTEDDLLKYVGYRAPGAWANGMRVEKIGSEADDTHVDGSLATIVGSVGPIPFEDGSNGYGYFVHWDDLPGLPVFIADTRIKLE